MAENTVTQSIGGPCPRIPRSIRGAGRSHGRGVEQSDSAGSRAKNCADLAMRRRRYRGSIESGTWRSTVGIYCAARSFGLLCRDASSCGYSTIGAGDIYRGGIYGSSPESDELEFILRSIIAIPVDVPMPSPTNLGFLILRNPIFVALITFELLQM